MDTRDLVDTPGRPSPSPSAQSNPSDKYWMLINELFEGFPEQRRKDRVQLGDLVIDIDEHLDEREAQRGIDHDDVLAVLRKINHARGKIMRLNRGDQFWLYDPELNTAIGMRLLNDETKRIMLKTALAKWPASPNPIFQV